MNFNQKEIRKLAAGDARMFGALYRIFFPKIHQFALMLLKNKQDADDVCQIIFMKVWLKREDFIGISNLDSYLFILSKNTIIDYISTKKNVESDEIPEYVDAVTPHEKLIVSDIQLLIDMVVENMPEQRQAVYRRSREQYLKNDEIAIKLGLQKKTVENHLNLALKDIKKALLLLLFIISLWG